MPCGDLYNRESAASEKISLTLYAEFHYLFTLNEVDPLFYSISVDFHNKRLTSCIQSENRPNRIFKFDSH